MKTNFKAPKKVNRQDSSENRKKELIYMSQYMALVINKERLATLKLTG